MILQVMAIFDSKARSYRTPIFVVHTDVGLRAVKGAVNNPGNELHDHAADFFIHHLGSFNDENGEFSPFALPFNFGCIAVLKVAAHLEQQQLQEQPS